MQKYYRNAEFCRKCRITTKCQCHCKMQTNQCIAENNIARPVSQTGNVYGKYCKINIAGDVAKCQHQCQTAQPTGRQGFQPESLHQVGMVLPLVQALVLDDRRLDVLVARQVAAAGTLFGDGGSPGHAPVYLNRCGGRGKRCGCGRHCTWPDTIFVLLPYRIAGWYAITADSRVGLRATPKGVEYTTAH